jgi:hypothetical protein
MPHRQVERTMRLALAGPADEAFPLFGPMREREWDPDWRPVVIAPDDGESCAAGTVFVVGGNPDSVWVMTRYDPVSRQVRYVMLQPGVVTSEIAVDVTVQGPRASAATVSYRRTALSAAGETALDEFLRVWPSWAAQWEGAINAVLLNVERRT